MLNMHKFSNGLDLRNKYCHGNNPIDENVSENNYYQILKIVCLVIIKINDEFCKYCWLGPKLGPTKKGAVALTGNDC